MKLFAEISRCFSLRDPGEKCTAVKSLAEHVAAGRFHFDRQCPTPDIRRPGRPQRPELISPSQVPRRRLGSEAGRAALVHAIAHIEFNAINLALDAACRFRAMPVEYFKDWISVAADEARHFLMLQRRLADMSVSYGDYPAHNGLWEMAENTADSCLVRMALVPRVLEARGLDVTPGMMERLQQIGDDATVAVLEVILQEEVAHVAIGSRWFQYCCAAEGKDPDRTFLQLLETRYAGSVRGPLNSRARLEAGFSPYELATLESSIT